MHVVQINFFVDTQAREPARLLKDWYALTDVAESVALAGQRVTVLQASRIDASMRQSGVHYRFADSANIASWPLHELEPDVIHVHGLSFAREVIGLRARMPETPILLQDHADHVPRFWRLPLWRRQFDAVQAASFCARSQAHAFVAAGIIASDFPVFEIPESPSRFRCGSRDGARELTGLAGNPGVLWIGGLDRNKDPLTVLDGISDAVATLPELQLWCCYTEAPLLRDVQSRIDGDARLRGRVHLLGRVPHERIEQLMRASDLFVLGSHREGGNFSLIEAMATGLMPVVTDIPSSRALTGDGAVGFLWPCGDARALSGALRGAAASLGTDTRSRVRAHFDAQLSASAIGRRFTSAYGRIVETGGGALGAVAQS